MSNVLTPKETSIIDELIDLLNKKINSVKSQINMMSGSTILERCNTICYFPENFLTIALDEQNRTCITAYAFATQFEPETAKMICEKTSNGNGVHPVMISPREFYPKLLEDLEKDLLEFKKTYLPA